MTAFDYIVLAIIVGSIIIAVMRGLVAEVVSLGAWVLAFWCAKRFSPVVSTFMPADLPNDSLRIAAAFVLVFFLVWLVLVVVRITLTGLLHSVGLGGINRFLGAMFGLARGMVVVFILVLLGGLSDLPLSPMWRNALLAPPLESAVLSLRPWLPPLLAENVRFVNR